MLEVLNTMSRYNRWMNGKLMDECSKLSDADRKLDRHAPFRSIHGVWNHLLVADRIWLSRFMDQPFSAKALDEELYSDWDELCAGRQQTDDGLDEWLGTVTYEMLDGELRFQRIVEPQPVVMPYGLCALHVFNHQTHHRGQMTALLEQAGGDCGVTDLLRLP